jgi:histidine ammonia-lyase
LRSGRGTEAAHKIARERIARWTDDRPPSPDIAVARELIASRELVLAAEAAIGRRLTT